MTDMLRVLASIATSEAMDPIFRERAKELISRIMENMKTQIMMEEQMLTKTKAEMNGIMT